MSSIQHIVWKTAKLGELLPIKYGKARVADIGTPRPGTAIFGSNGAFGTYDRALTNGPTLIIGRKGAAGAVHLSPEPCWPIDTAFYAEGREDISLPFFRYLLDSLRLGALDRSTAIPSLSRDDYNATVVKYPESPDEQCRIVAEIEKQLTRLEAGLTALRRVQANLKRYRAAVLKAACEGKLVPTEAELQRTACRAEALGRRREVGGQKSEVRGQPAPSKRSGEGGGSEAGGTTPDFESGAMLLQRILAERRAKWQGRGKYKEPAAPDTANLPPLPEGWAWATVAQLGQTTTGFTPPKNDASLFSGDIPFFKPSDLDVGYYVREFRDSLTEAGAEHGRVLHELSILVTCIGATIGKTGLARVRCTTNQQINALTVPTELVSPQFVYWCFSSPFGQRQIIDNASATTLPILNKSRFKALPIPLPPLTEQKRIVAEVERRLSVIGELESAVNANLQRAGRLRQSILQRAFAGEIVT